MELYARVRRSVIVEGHNERETARLYRLARETVRMMPRYSAPPAQRRQQAAMRPKRIFEGVREERGYAGGYAISGPRVFPMCPERSVTCVPGRTHSLRAASLNRLPKMLPNSGELHQRER